MVGEVEDGVWVVVLAQSLRPDVCLFDIRMPMMDGLEATRFIRAYEATCGLHTPMVALTANAMVGDREACLEAGMDGFLSKPFQLDELDRLLQHWRRLPEILPPAVRRHA